jgi:hypothetical protein
MVVFRRHSGGARALGATPIRVVAALALLSSPARAAEQGPQAPPLRAARIEAEDTPPVVDGRSRKRFWSRAEGPSLLLPISLFFFSNTRYKKLIQKQKK